MTNIVTNTMRTTNHMPSLSLPGDLAASGPARIVSAMHTMLSTYTLHTTMRLKEVAAALVAVGGAFLVLGAMMPMGRRGGQVLAGLALAAGGVVGVIALHWGTLK
jgi:hypothetical protein